MPMTDVGGSGRKTDSTAADKRISVQPPDLVSHLSDPDQLILHGKRRPKIKSAMARNQKSTTSDDPSQSTAPTVAVTPVSQSPLSQHHAPLAQATVSVSRSNVQHKKGWDASPSVPLEGKTMQSAKTKSAPRVNLNSASNEEAEDGPSRGASTGKSSNISSALAKTRKGNTKAVKASPLEGQETSMEHASTSNAPQSEISREGSPLLEPSQAMNPKVHISNPAQMNSPSSVSNQSLSSPPLEHEVTIIPSGASGQHTCSQPAPYTTGSNSPNLLELPNPPGETIRPRLDATDDGKRKSESSNDRALLPGAPDVGVPRPKISKRVSITESTPKNGAVKSHVPLLSPEQPEVAALRIPLPMVEAVRYFRPAVKKHLLHSVLKLSCDAPHLEHTHLLSIADLSTSQLMELQVSPDEMATQAYLHLQQKGSGQRRTSTFLQRIYLTFSDPSSSSLAKLVSLAILSAILLSTCAYCYQSFPHVPSSATEWRVLVNVERVTVAIFTVEYIVRLFTCDSRYRFFFSILNTVDLIAILPFYAELIIRQIARSRLRLETTRVLRVVRLIRVFRIFKAGHQYKQLQVVGSVIWDSRDILVVWLYVLFLAVLMFSSIVFYCEEFYREIYGDTGVREFTSIPGTFWWSMVTLSTIGYGDKVPKTPFGKISAGVLMGCAIVFMSLPISVVGTQFTQHWVNYKKQADREERTAIAFDKLSELVDNLVDHFKVMEDFECVEGGCEVRLRCCLTQLYRYMQQVEAAYLSGMSGGRSPKAAANLIRNLLIRIEDMLLKAKQSHLELRALIKASKCSTFGSLTAGMNELYISCQQLTKWYEESHFLLNDCARVRREIHNVKRRILSGAVDGGS